MNFSNNEATCPIKIDLSGIPRDLDFLYFIIWIFFIIFFFPCSINISIDVSILEGDPYSVSYGIP